MSQATSKRTCSKARRVLVLFGLDRRVLVLLGLDRWVPVWLSRTTAAPRASIHPWSIITYNDRDATNPRGNRTNYREADRHSERWCQNQEKDNRRRAKWSPVPSRVA